MTSKNTELYRDKLEKLLEGSDIKINGNNPWDIQVHDSRLYQRILTQGSLGLGESYIEGWWNSKKLDQFFTKIFEANIHNKAKSVKFLMKNFDLIKQFAQTKLLNMQSISKSKKVAETHYDIGNDFYELMLGPTMQYTCAYWKRANSLNQAQIDKMDLVCKKLNLENDKVLELGFGWGSFAKFMADNYNCDVSAFNISNEQVKYAIKKNNHKNIKFIQNDYRFAKGKFDNVASIGLCEHVGSKNYKTLMEVVHKALKPGGLFLLHTIGKDKTGSLDPFINKYIFPNGMIPTAEQITIASNGLFVIEDWHNFGADYDKTLMAWNKNFQENWPKFNEQYGDSFKRMWEYYLLSCAGAFRSRTLQLWQIVLAKDVGIKSGYNPIR